MHRSEEARLLPCAACGREVTRGVGRDYEFGAERVLCWDCAVARGGDYDEQQDRWAIAPRVDEFGPPDGGS